MTQNEERLSAYLDGELAEAEAAEVEAALAANPALQAELESLMAADTLAKDAFGDVLADPVPASLAAAIRDADSAPPANTPTAPSWFSGWVAVAAACAMLFIGGAGGFFLGTSRGVEIAQTPVWLTDIANYHAIYAEQDRYMENARGANGPYVMRWLTDAVGARVRLPDLEENGLTLKGARLLVAAGKPVAQLVYEDANGGVVALCLIATDTPQDGFAEEAIGAFEMVTWGGSDANFVVVGDEGRGDLNDIAQAAALQV